MERIYQETHRVWGGRIFFLGEVINSLFSLSPTFSMSISPEQFRKYLRKTIALVDQIEEEPTNFYRLIESTLFDNPGIKASTKSKASKSQLKALSILNLSLNIIHWSQEADNLRPALLGAERMLVRTWDWMRINNLLDDSKAIVKYMQVVNTYFQVMATFAKKIEVLYR